MMLSTRTVRKRRFSLPVAAECLSHERTAACTRDAGAALGSPDAFVKWQGVEDVQRFYSWIREHRAGETRGAMLLSEINVAYYQRLMAGMREAIGNGSFEAFQKQTRAGWARGDIAAR